MHDTRFEIDKLIIVLSIFVKFSVENVSELLPRELVKGLWSKGVGYCMGDGSVVPISYCSITMTAFICRQRQFF